MMYYNVVNDDLLDDRDDGVREENKNNDDNDGDVVMLPAEYDYHELPLVSPPPRPPPPLSEINRSGIYKRTTRYST